jgi:hypothetical protein
LPLITNIIKDSYNLVAADATTYTHILYTLKRNSVILPHFLEK